MGMWQWLREYIEFVTRQQPEDEFFRDVSIKDRVAHVLQLAQEGGHSMLTPPHLLTLVHAVQQPIGQPGFARLTMQVSTSVTGALQTQPEGPPTASTELGNRLKVELASHTAAPSQKRDKRSWITFLPINSIRRISSDE